jgi:hypothetical protein
MTDFIILFILSFLISVIILNAILREPRDPKDRRFKLNVVPVQPPPPKSSRKKCKNCGCDYD